MTAGDLAVVLAAGFCTIGFAALVVVLLRVLDTLRALRTEVDHLREETRPLLSELRATMIEARDDLDRFDRVLGSAEAISDAVAGGSSRVARVALSAPVIKTVALATGTGRTTRRLRRNADATPARRAR